MKFVIIFVALLASSLSMKDFIIATFFWTFKIRFQYFKGSALECYDCVSSERKCDNVGFYTKTRVSKEIRSDKKKHELCLLFVP